MYTNLFPHSTHHHLKSATPLLGINKVTSASCVLEWTIYLAKASSSKDEVRSQKNNQIKGCKWLSRYHFVFCGSADSQNFQFFTTSLNNIDSQIKSSADKWKYWIQSIRDSCMTIITKGNCWNFYFSQKSKIMSCHISNFNIIN